MRNYIINLFLFISFCNTAYGQDLVYSQYYASPLTTNPALTGVFNGSTRLNGNYRSQWNNINTNSSLYNTPSASADISIPEKNLAVGLVFVNDQTNNKIFNTLEAGLSFGYKLRLNLFEISMGIQGWYKQIYFDQSKVQSTNISIEPSLLNNYSNLNLNAGALLTYMFPDEKNSVFYGASIHNLLGPRDQVTQNSINNYTLPIRYVFHAGGSFIINDEYQILPGLLVTYQNKSTQVNLGTSIGFHFDWDERDKPIKTLYVGTWFRLNETKFQSFIPKAGIDFQNFRFGFSYDYILNSLSNANEGRPNSYEFSIGYIFKTDKSTDFQCIYNPFF